MLLPRSRLCRHATAAVYAPRTSLTTSRAFHASAAVRAIDMSKVNTTERLAELRKLMKERKVDIYSTKPWSSNPRHVLTRTQWYRPKIATRANTSPLATPVEVRSPAASRSTSIDSLQHISVASRALLATPSLHTTRPLYLQTDATSTRLRRSWTATGSCSSRASRMSRLSRSGQLIAWRVARSLPWILV